MTGHLAYTMAVCVWALPMLASAQSQAPQPAPAAADTPTTELDTIRVIERRPEWIDPFRYRSDFNPDDNRFHRQWNESPTVEDVSMRGGYILLGINYGLLKVAEQVTRLPGWKHQIQPATARPPPLDEAQLERAIRLQDAQEP